MIIDVLKKWLVEKGGNISGAGLYFWRRGTMIPFWFYGNFVRAYYNGFVEFQYGDPDLFVNLEAYIKWLSVDFQQPQSPLSFTMASRICEK